MSGKENIVKEKILPVVKTVVAVTVITVILLMIWSLLLLKMGFSDKVILIGIGVIYFISNFTGGFIIGKVKEKRKFIWGFAVGFTYFWILAIVSYIVTGQVFQGEMSVIAAALCCAGGGFIGGMLS